MTTFQRIFVSCFVSVALPLSASSPQTLADPLAGLESAQSRVRIEAFYRLFDPPLSFAVNAREGTLTLLRNHPEDREDIVRALVGLLSRENSLINDSPSGSLPESYGEYHASLIWSVATLRDGRATDALLGAITTGALASGGLVAIGVPAIPATLRAVESPDAQVRADAVMVLGEMVSKRDELGLDGTNADMIRSVVLRAVGDQENAVRVAAVLSLGAFSDAGVRSAIQRSAIVDSSEQVRQVANEWLVKHPSD